MSKVRNVVIFTLFIRILTLLKGPTFQAFSMFLRCVQIQLPCSRSSAAEVSRSKHHGCHNYHDYHHDNKHEHNDDFWLSSWTFKFFQHMVGSPKNEQKHETVSEENLAVAPTLEVFMLTHENLTLNLYTLPETNIFLWKQAFCPKSRFHDSEHPFFKGFWHRLMERCKWLWCSPEFFSMCLWGLQHCVSTCETFHPCVWQW